MKTGKSYSYDVFGDATIRDANDQILTTSDVSNPYMFTGRRYDDETDLYYYRARYYDPYIGRFLQPDSIGYGDGLNMYTYVGNNPVGRFDQSGTLERCVEKLNISVQIVSIAMQYGNCEEWLIKHGYKGESFRVHLHSSCHPVCYFRGAFMWTLPISNAIGVCERSCENDIMTNAILLIHEVAHHYCPFFVRDREECPNTAMKACLQDPIFSGAY